ncbi:hypothetical protein AYX15_00120 [Cryptococcus neoformans]|nr:hypothetical protein AYX15_00120 [Cryptococcus neoformans var. grubii]
MASSHSGPASPASSTPPPSSAYARLIAPTITRNSSSSSSRSTTTCSSTSSVQAVPMRPPPIETSTAATSRSQLPSNRHSENEAEHDTSYTSPGLSVGGRGGLARNGPRSNRLGTSPQARHVPPSIVALSPSPSPILNMASKRQSNTETVSGTSPSTPLGKSFLAQQDLSPNSSTIPLRVTISVDPNDRLSHDRESHSAERPRSSGNSPVRGRHGHLSTPSSPTNSYRALGGKPRTLSVDAGQNWGGSHRSRARDGDDRERRQSQVSSASSGALKKHSLDDWVLGEELGVGSYSTVYCVTPSANTHSPTSPQPARKYALKVINQAHLIQEKKVKYAMVERDALIRLSDPRPSKGHKRGVSSSSSSGYAQTGSAGKRRSTASIGGQSSMASVSGGTVSNSKKDTRDRLSIVTTSSAASSPVLTASSGSTQLSPTAVSGGGGNIKGRRPSRSAEPPTPVQEQTEMLIRGGEDGKDGQDGQETPSREWDRDRDWDNMTRSRPPSPVREESAEGGEKEKDEEEQSGAEPAELGAAIHLTLPPPQIPSTPEPRGSPLLSTDGHRTSRETPRDRPHLTPKRRRQSLAPSERSVKSASTTGKMSAAAHPGVVRLYSTFNDSSSLYFVLSLASNGELASIIRKHGSLDITSARYYAAQLIDTLEFVHSRGVIHRDLKPENILLDEDMRIKITDFGSAKIIAKDEPIVDDSSRSRSFVGSADFVSPEVLRNEVATTASDIWAFGCVLYQFICGKPPFRGATDYLTFQKILKREVEFPKGIDEDAKSLIDTILDLEPNLRPSITFIKTHPFFQPIDFSTLWTIPAPPISSGLREPSKSTTTLAQLEASDIWGVFEGSDVGEEDEDGFEYDADTVSPRPEGGAVGEGMMEPLFDRRAAASAVHNVDHPKFSRLRNQYINLGEDLDPPRPAYAGAGTGGRGKREKEVEKKKGGKARGLSHGSESSGGNRSALAGWLEAIKFGGAGGGGMSGSATSVAASDTVRTPGTGRLDLDLAVVRGPTGEVGRV